MGYALILWGGYQDGHRPHTAVAYVTPADKSGQRTADIIDGRGRSRYKRAKQISDNEVLHEFGRDLPTARQIRAARQALPVYMCEEA